MSSAVCWRTAPHHDVPTSKLPCWYGVFRVMCHLTSKHGLYYGIQRVQFWSHLTRLYSPSTSQACLNAVQQTLNKLQHAFSSAMESCVVSVHSGHGGWVHYLLFSLKQLYLLIPGVSEALHMWPLALGQLFWSFFSLLWQKSCEEHQVVAGLWWNYVLSTTFRGLEILLWPMPSVCFATIRLRRSWESSLLVPIMRCFLCDTLVMRNLFIGHQFGLNQMMFICTDKGQDCFLITDRFQLVSWLSIPFCTSLSSCVQYFFPVSFHFITHNLISELISLFVWITWVVTDICWKCHVNSTFRNIFTEKNGDVFNTYFTRCIRNELTLVKCI